MEQTKWFDRKFPAVADNGLLPSIIERLDGTPARLREISGRIDPESAVTRLNGKWSIQEEIGHLGDVEPLWLARLGDLANGLPELRPADLTNRKTQDANHNAANTNNLIKQFSEQRMLFVSQLMNLNDGELLKTSLHPRLKTPMRVIDLAFFVAEHDDHHLAHVRSILAVLKKEKSKAAQL